MNDGIKKIDSKTVSAFLSQPRHALIWFLLFIVGWANTMVFLAIDEIGLFAISYIVSVLCGAFAIISIFVELEGDLE